MTFASTALRKQGYVLVVHPDGRMEERDTVTCRHCQRVIELKPGTWGQVYLIPDADGRYHEQAGAYCRKCMAPICHRCDDRGDCEHWERTLERIEAKAALHAAMGG